MSYFVCFEAIVGPKSLFDLQELAELVILLEPFHVLSLYKQNNYSVFDTK